MFTLIDFAQCLFWNFSIFIIKEIHIENSNLCRRGKSKLFSMFWISKVYSLVKVVNVSNFFQFTMEKYSNCLKELLLVSNLILVYNKMISDFHNLFLKYIQRLFHSFCKRKYKFFPKKVINILKKALHMNRPSQHYLNEWKFTELNRNKFFPSSFCKQFERVWNQFDWI